MTLEQKIEKLNELSDAIESDIPLEKALVIFEESVKLAGECIDTLNDCKGKLTILQEKVKRITDEN